MTRTVPEGPAEKTRRGLRGRVESGKAGGGLCYRYRVVGTMTGTSVSTGEREIEPSEAAVVERILPRVRVRTIAKANAKMLNQQFVPDHSKASGARARCTATSHAVQASCTTGCTSAAWCGIACAT